MALVSWLVQKFNRCGDATDMKEHQPVLTLTLDCDSAIAFIKLCLFEKGFQAQQRFGLTSACATFSDPVCPHSPDQLCNCQLITLQVCRSDLPGIPIILHGHDKLTEIYYMEEDTVPEDVLAALKQAELRIQ